MLITIRRPSTTLSQISRANKWTTTLIGHPSHPPLPPPPGLGYEETSATISPRSGRPALRTRTVTLRPRPPPPSPSPPPPPPPPPPPHTARDKERKGMGGEEPHCGPGLLEKVLLLSPFQNLMMNLTWQGSSAERTRSGGNSGKGGEGGGGGGGTNWHGGGRERYDDAAATSTSTPAGERSREVGTTSTSSDPTKG